MFRGYLSAQNGENEKSTKIGKIHEIAKLNFSFR